MFKEIGQQIRKKKESTDLKYLIKNVKKVFSKLFRYSLLVSTVRYMYMKLELSYFFAEMKKNTQVIKINNWRQPKVSFWFLAWALMIVLVAT
jgi:hypothetical protein